MEVKETFFADKENKENIKELLNNSYLCDTEKDDYRTTSVALVIVQAMNAYYTLLNTSTPDKLLHALQKYCSTEWTEENKNLKKELVCVINELYDSMMTQCGIARDAHKEAEAMNVHLAIEENKNTDNMRIDYWSSLLNNDDYIISS